MNKTVKYITFFCVGAIVLGVMYMNLYRLFFTGTFDKKYKREEVGKHFVQHEKEFYELVNYFESIIPRNNKRMIMFGLGEKGTINLSAPLFDGSESNFLGGYNLDINSPKLDSVLFELNWTMQNVVALREKLFKTDCQWIRATNFYGNPIQIYYRESGMGSFSYFVFESALTDSLKEIHGNPISETNFGRRVAINYSSAL